MERCYFGEIHVQIRAKLHQSHNCLLNLIKHVGAPSIKLKGRLFIRHTESGITIVTKQLAGFNTSSKSHSIRNWNPQPCLSKYLRSWISYFHHLEKKSVGRGRAWTEGKMGVTLSHCVFKWWYTLTYFIICILTTNEETLLCITLHVTA